MLIHKRAHEHLLALAHATPEILFIILAVYVYISGCLNTIYRTKLIDWNRETKSVEITEQHVTQPSQDEEYNL